MSTHLGVGSFLAKVPRLTPAKVVALLAAMLGAVVALGLGAPAASAATFSNNNGITIDGSFDECPTPVSTQPRAADPYPSEIAVSGLASSISDVNVTVSGLSHGSPDDVGLLLVSPTGQSTLLMTDSGGVNTNVSGINLTFDDAASGFLPNGFFPPLTSGTYKPSVGVSSAGCLAPGSFPDPAPAGPYTSSLSVFNGSDPNGTWKLYVIDDSLGDRGSITGWSLTINSPTAVDDSYTTDEDTPLSVAKPGVLGNDKDPDSGDTLGAVLVSGPSHAATNGFTLNKDGSFTYTPEKDFNGSDSFTYKASDGTDDSNVATVRITVNSVNDAPPDAQGDSAATDEDTAVLIDVLANDSDVDGDTLSITGVTNPAHGTAVVDNDKINYTPAQDYNGPDSFSYTVSDGNGGEDTATVSISVTPVNDAPEAHDDSATTAEDTPINIAVLSNDTDVEGDTRSVSNFDATSDQGGTLSKNADGTLKYTPAANYNGPDSFTYKATDDKADSNTATVALTVNAVNDAPVLANIESGALTYTENDGPKAITSALTLADVDNTNLSGATVQITGNYQSSQDVLAFTDQNGISGSWDATTGTLTLTGSASLANYQSALRSVTYENMSEDPSTLARTVSFKVDDGQAQNNLSNAQTRDITLNALNDAPTVEVAAGGSCGTNDRSGQINLIVNDPDGLTQTGSLKLSATDTSNKNLVPTSNVTFGGSGASRTLTATALSGKNGTATITVTVTDTDKATGKVAFTLQAGGNSNDTLTGSSATDILLGQNGDDTLSGLGGNDLMCGARGNDRLTGGLGADRFEGGSGNDRATDFTPSQGDTKDNTVETF
jgi:subtilisin-like proprotein convertase family protein